MEITCFLSLDDLLNSQAAKMTMPILTRQRLLDRFPVVRTRSVEQLQQVYASIPWRVLCSRRSIFNYSSY